MVGILGISTEVNLDPLDAAAEVRRCHDDFTQVSRQYATCKREPHPSLIGGKYGRNHRPI